MPAPPPESDPAMVSALGGVCTPSVGIMNQLSSRAQATHFARNRSLAQGHSSRTLPAIAIAPGKGYAPPDHRLNGKSIGGLSCHVTMSWTGVTGGGATLPWQAS